MNRCSVKVPYLRLKLSPHLWSNTTNKLRQIIPMAPLVALVLEVTQTLLDRVASIGAQSNISFPLMVHENSAVQLLILAAKTFSFGCLLMKIYKTIWIKRAKIYNTIKITKVLIRVKSKIISEMTPYNFKCNRGQPKNTFIGKNITPKKLTSSNNKWT